jgi:hypothetical protein
MTEADRTSGTANTQFGRSVRPLHVEGRGWVLKTPVRGRVGSLRQHGRLPDRFQARIRQDLSDTMRPHKLARRNQGDGSFDSTP